MRDGLNRKRHTIYTDFFVTGQTPPLRQFANTGLIVSLHERTHAGRIMDAFIHNALSGCKQARLLENKKCILVVGTVQIRVGNQKQGRDGFTVYLCEQVDQILPECRCDVVRMLPKTTSQKPFLFILDQYMKELSSCYLCNL